MKLKPMGKILLVLVVAGAAAGAYFGFFHESTTETATATAPATATATTTQPAAVTPTTTPGAVAGVQAPAAIKPTGVQPKTHYKVALSQWPGHMAGIIACGGLTTQPGSICAKEGIQLEFVFIEEPDKKNAALQSGEVDFTWQVVDEMPLNMPGYARSGVEAQAFVQIDWSRGGDACVAAANVKTPRDLLASRGAAMMKFSPDHTVYEFWINNSDLNPQEVRQLRQQTKFSMDSWEFGRNLFCQKQVDVACLWEPDVTLALECRPGAHRVFSTKDADTLVADVLLGKKDFLQQQPEIARKVAKIFMEGAKLGTADKPAAARLISTVVPRFRDELKYEGTLKALNWVRWNDLGDNTSFFGLGGTAPLFDTVYKQADSIWSEYTEPDGTPVLSQRFSAHGLRTAAIVKPLYDAEMARRQQVAASSGVAAVPVAAAKPVYNPQVAKTAAPKLVKPVSIHFDTGAYAIDTQSRSILKRQVLPQLMLATAMSIRVEGNTDDVGSDSGNKTLSGKRAQAVVDYLISQGIDPARIAAQGNGEDNPLCDLKTPDCRSRNRRTEILFVSAN
jgi:outer membrane protein OmpA-like peptidoglycan-associated protein/ABC-type nitrate/sulfonate/bicarbonate transport system substrate-binding protein